MSTDAAAGDRDADEHDPARCTGWATPPDSDAPRLCPLCRDASRRRIRPVQEYAEPKLSDRAYEAISRADAAEREERTALRGDNV